MIKVCSGQRVITFVDSLLFECGARFRQLPVLLPRLLRSLPQLHTTTSPSYVQAHSIAIQHRAVWCFLASAHVSARKNVSITRTRALKRGYAYLECNLLLISDLHDLGYGHGIHVSVDRPQH